MLSWMLTFMYAAETADCYTQFFLTFVDKQGKRNLTDVQLICSRYNYMVRI